MSEPPNASELVRRVEWFLGIGEPNLRSRSRGTLQVALGIPIAVLSGSSILWYAFSGGGRGPEVLLQCGVLLLMLQYLSDGVGTSLYVRRGAARGRALRVFGYAVFFPLSMVSYLAYFWFSATWLFVLGALLLAALLIHWAVRAWRGPRDRSRSDSFDGA